MLTSVLNFGYHSEIKRYAEFCAYTGEPFNKKRKATVEHIHPHSKSGANHHSNYLATLAKPNTARGNIPFKEWIEMNQNVDKFKRALKKYKALTSLKFQRIPNIVENIQKYLNAMRGVSIQGQDHVKQVVITLNREMGRVVFRGGNLKLNKTA